MSQLNLPPIAGVRAGEPGEVDKILCLLAERLESSGSTLVGAVQEDIKRTSRCRCDMTLNILGSEFYYPISTDLGPQSKGCRLDAGALEQAAWHVEATLKALPVNARPGLMIINKFSKSESHGKGFLPAIAQALDLDIPVLCGIGRLSLDDFNAFADGHAQLLQPGMAAIDQWVKNCLSTHREKTVIMPTSIRSTRGLYPGING